MITTHMKKISLAVSCAMSMALAPVAAGSDGIENTAPAPTQQVAGNDGWTLGLPQEDKVVYKGVVSYDGAGTQGGAMMYPAPNVGGFLAAIITHGLIVETMKGHQKSKLQEDADLVLSPYKTILDSYSNKELMDAGLDKASIGDGKKLVAFSEKPGGERFIQSTPVFSMTQDQKAIILENVVSIHISDSPSVAPYQNVIKVISQVKETTDPVNYWTANEGEKLKAESASLLAHSLEIAVSDAVNREAAENPRQKTFRYQEGQVLKMERAHLVSEKCSRRVIKNLRGWLMSIPVAQDADSSGNQCADMVSALN